MFNIYGKFGLTSPSWLVRWIGKGEYIKCFNRLSPIKLLDIGCGSGEKREVIPSSANYFGIDHNDCPHGLSAADAIATAYDLPFLEGSFDTVFCSAVLEHLEEPELAIREAHRVLGIGGVAVYSIPFIWHIHEEPRDFFRYSRYGITHLFEKAGFEIDEIKPLSGFWVTFGSEFNYYLNKFRRGLLRHVIPSIIAVNNLAFLGLEKLSKPDERWTWMYLVVARKK